MIISFGVLRQEIIYKDIPVDLKRYAIVKEDFYK